MNSIDPIVLIIIFSSTIILSYFFNLYSKRSGIPSVLLLIFTGMLINFGFFVSEMGSPNLFSILKILGVVGLALIVLEAALDLKLIKEKSGLDFQVFVYSNNWTFCNSLCWKPYFELRA